MKTKQAYTITTWQDAVTSEWHFKTDSVSATINAMDLDDACAKFAVSEGIKGVTTEETLVTYIERMGGQLWIHDERGDLVCRA